jgi:hypothetical protein
MSVVAIMKVNEYRRTKNRLQPVINILGILANRAKALNRSRGIQLMNEATQLSNCNPLAKDSSKREVLPVIPAAYFRLTKYKVNRNREKNKIPNK